MNRIIEVFIKRDEMSVEEAVEQFKVLKEEAMIMMDDGEDPADIMSDLFGLEEEYFLDLIGFV